MMNAIPACAPGAETKIAIQLCTYQRPHVVDTLASLAQQRVPGARLHLFVIDNDDSESAQERVMQAAQSLSFGFSYLHAPAHNIALARNACLDAATALGADWIAFIDDDEIAPSGWLARLFQRAGASGADGVFGPIRASYPLDAPQWMRDLAPHSRGYDHADPRTGNTGNALLRWRGAPWQDRRFDPLHGRTGGEDIAFFSALHDMGARFAIAPDAEVIERIERHRMHLDWLAHRRFRSGQSHVAVATSRLARGGMLLSAAARAGYCRAMQIISQHDEARRNQWFLQLQHYRGTCAGVMGRDAQLFDSRPADRHPKS